MGNLFNLCFCTALKVAVTFFQTPWMDFEQTDNEWWCYKSKGLVKGSSENRFLAIVAPLVVLQYCNRAYKCKMECNETGMKSR